VLYVTVIIFLVVLALAGAFAADIDPGCLTRAQAKAKWPKAWLYWHTQHHCWDNRAGRRHAPHMRDPVFGRNYAMDTSKKQDRLQPPKVVQSDEYNEIDAQADRDPFFRNEPLSMWPPIIVTRPQLSPPRFIPWEERISGGVQW
jgi:hypothetical protein